MTSEDNDTPAADAVADAEVAEEYFITEMILCTLSGATVSPLIGGRRVMEPILSALDPGAPRIIHYMCGEDEKSAVHCDEHDVNYVDDRQILTRQEIRILRWAEKNLTQNGKDICVAMVAMRVMIGAISPDIKTYCCIRNGELILPSLPVRMRLMPVLGVVWPDVPAWGDIIKSLVMATGRPNLNREMERLLVHVLSDLMYAVQPSNTATARGFRGFRDRVVEVGDRIEGIVATVPEDDWKLFDGRRGGGGGGGGRLARGGTSRVGVGKRSSPAPKTPRPRGRVLRPRWG